MQEAALRTAGCERVLTEKASGTTTAGRPQLALALDRLRRGDALVVTRIDRLARSIGDLQVVVRQLRELGAALVCTEQPAQSSRWTP